MIHYQLQRCYLLCFVIALCFLESSERASARADQEQIETASLTYRVIKQGALTGFIADNGAHVWRSVPYAASTAGDNRWRAPQPALRWGGVRDASIFGDRCPQVSNAFSQGEGIEPGILMGAEDCLFADIYAPPDAMDRSLPVMVWIHGGGNVWGTSQNYDGSRLAVHENVIIVAVQYRLGPLGWFSHASLEAEGEGANFGTLDLIAALKWVRDNVSAFGGNPNLVTIFGESAGGHNVATLLAAPKAKGLFHRAILQSGSFDSVSVDEARGAVGEIANPSNKIVQKLGVNSAAELRALSISDLYDAYVADTGFLDLPLIIEDGVVLPAQKMRDLFSSTDVFHAVPIMTGTNRDEMKLFQVLNPAMTRTLFGTFYQARNQKLYDATSHYMSRVWRVRSVDGPAALMQAGGHDAVYAYRFDWDDGGSFLFTNLAKMLGAAHGVEIPFIFNRFELLGRADRIMFQKKTKASREALSRAMGQYWASFARNGVPSAKGAPTWPVYGEEAALMRLDAKRRKKDRGLEVITGADTINDIVRELQNDDRLSQKQRCEIARGVADWVPSLKATVTDPVCQITER